MHKYIAHILSILMLVLLASCKDYADLQTYRQRSFICDKSERYGVRWSLTNPDDLGERCFAATNKKATIGIGRKLGNSDFDDIYPWSKMRRCNISQDGIVIFEGEDGFSLDGTSGDVFVRIPVFYIERYVEDGYEYRIISQHGNTPHPAFIENGRVLDAVYVSAFEGYTENNRLYSRADVIPSSCHTPQEFLNMAQLRGRNYSLYDMRTVDMLFDLIAVEYGCRNTSVIFGHGIAQYKQPIEAEWEPDRIYYSKQKANGVNCFVGRMRKETRKITVGSNICICKVTQANVLTFARILSISQSKCKDQTIYEFDGSPIDIDTDCFIGNCAQSTNWTETCSSPLLWHTGRANMKDDYTASQRNPMRYRWIENIVGNLWHYLPDVTFNNLQMYVCRNMEDYKMHSIQGAYEPIGQPLPENNDLSRQIDERNVNYWITSLSENSAEIGIPFGCSYDKSLLSSQAFGAYYYLRKGVNIIANGGGFDHEFRCNLLTNRAWIAPDAKWFLYGARLIYKELD